MASPIDTTKTNPSMSTLKTEPTGRAMVLPTEDVPAYKALIDTVNRQYRPESYLEQLHAQSIVDCEWRLQRVSRLEEALLIVGRKELGAEFASEPDSQKRASLIDGKARVKHQKLFKTLAQQERFLRKQLKQDAAELSRLQRDNPKSKRRGLFLVAKPTKKS
jgi:hypothetical protein